MVATLPGKPGSTDFWRDRSVFVTGGTGLVGSALVRDLVRLGADVTCLMRDWVPMSELLRSGALSRVKLVQGDVRDQTRLAEALAEYEVDTVFHLAAQTIVGVANTNPVGTFEVNIAGTWAVLEAARLTPCVKQVVVASSDKAYGVKDTLPYDETMGLDGCHPYDVSKSCADLIAQTYARSYHLPVTITRCGNFFGGGDLNWSRLVPGTVRSVLRGEAPVIRSDGSFIRDYIYVGDAVSGYLTLAEAMATTPDLAGEAFNFSTEMQLTALEMVKKILALMGSDLRPRILDTASNEIPHQYLTAAKARRRLGWQPAFGLEAGLRLTIDWYRDYLAEKERTLVV